MGDKEYQTLLVKQSNIMWMKILSLTDGLNKMNGQLYVKSGVIEENQTNLL